MSDAPHAPPDAPRPRWPRIRWLPLTIIGLILLVGLGVTVGFLRRAREMSNRSYCAANLKGIGQSINIYAGDGVGYFPLVPPGLNGEYIDQRPAKVVSKNADITINSLYAQPSGDVRRSLWIIALRQMAAPKQFVCLSDPFAAAPAQLTDANGGFFDSFQSDSQFSYAVTYPYHFDSGDRPATWWFVLTDSSLPLISDIGPKHGDRFNGVTINVTTIDNTRNPRQFNSPNHRGDGQNVAFSDAHVEWLPSPVVPSTSDNLWTLGELDLDTGKPVGTGQPLAGDGTIPGMTRDIYPPFRPKRPMRIEKPFDIIMVPVRTSTGALK